MVVIEPLREDAHTQLVKWCSAESPKCLFFQRRRLTCPCIAGRPQFPVGCAVGIDKAVLVLHLHRSVVSGPRCIHRERTCLPVQLRMVAPRTIRPCAHCVRHKAHAVRLSAVVEAIRRNRLSALLECGAEFYVRIRIVCRRSRKRNLKDSPLLDICGRSSPPFCGATQEASLPNRPYGQQPARFDQFSTRPIHPSNSPNRGSCPTI